MPAREARTTPVGNEKTRVLLLVTTRSYRAGAFLAAASSLGVEMVVGTERRQALASLNPAGNLTLPFGSPHEALGLIVRHAARRPFAAVIAADDDGALLAASASAALGLRHHVPAAVATSLDKHAARSAFEKAGLPTPGFELVSVRDDPQRVAERTVYPCVLKPRSFSASRGVIRADDPGSFVVAFVRLRALVGQASPGGDTGSVLVESYVPGRELGIEGVMDRGRLRLLALFDKPDPLEGPYFEETIYVTPSREDPRVQAAVAQRVQDMASATGLAEGPVHAEVRVNDEDVWPLEIAPRSIGGLCSRALRFEGGRSLEEVLLAQALGRPEGRLEREPGAGGVMMIPVPASGRLRDIRGTDRARQVPGVWDVVISMRPGERVVAWPEGSRYPGFIFARGGGPDAVEAALREAHRCLELDIELERGSETTVGRERG